MSYTKLAIDNIYISISVPSKPKDEKVYISHFKRNNKEKAYVARLDKGKSFDVNVEVSKPKSKFTGKLHKKSVFVLTCHLCGIVDHIRPNCSLLRQNQNLRLDLQLGILMFLNLFLFVPFVLCLVTFILTVIN